MLGNEVDVADLVFLVERGPMDARHIKVNRDSENGSGRTEFPPTLLGWAKRRTEKLYPGKMVAAVY
jgi:hypothetical protein